MPRAAPQPWPWMRTPPPLSPPTPSPAAQASPSPLRWALRAGPGCTRLGSPPAGKAAGRYPAPAPWAVLPGGACWPPSSRPAGWVPGAEHVDARRSSLLPSDCYKTCNIALLKLLDRTPGRVLVAGNSILEGVVEPIQTSRREGRHVPARYPRGCCTDYRVGMSGAWPGLRKGVLCSFPDAIIFSVLVRIAQGISTPVLALVLRAGTLRPDRGRGPVPTYQPNHGTAMGLQPQQAVSPCCLTCLQSLCRA